MYAVGDIKRTAVCQNKVYISAYFDLIKYCHIALDRIPAAVQRFREIFIVKRCAVLSFNAADNAAAVPAAAAILVITRAESTLFY